MEAVKACINGWFTYVNRDMGDTDFSTDILAYIASDEEELKELKESSGADGRPDLRGFLDREEALQYRWSSLSKGFFEQHRSGLVCKRKISKIYAT